ncbi:DUF177 domain-containing protein [Aurantimonas sp. C2-6-R+9]|uniref:YceD family protein n=1 Tax=unclassified Aurantimonas TaxID=2638230 RepID=UPI002E17337B|nr:MULTISPECIES: DUF177 domain-containing protein [unclassified Aurantimonas]MEC5290594.1 DUF177 domain-containing protein [Aurantimonas sp. C2-3-R2]MEC5380691.1 DUF177 domain-containing protein [Aurantimonas sp. C2-6-R+9]MEC5411738.1 DUF177 domain-containing protein [Aurantimonas sp. C2-4-R8]
MTREFMGSKAIRYPISPLKLPRDGMLVRFEADETERGALAGELDISAVETFVGDLRVLPWRAEGVRVTGQVAATVVQLSVVSLEPLRQTITEPFELIFVPEGSKLARIDQPGEQELYTDPEGEDPPEVYAGHTIDLGPYLVEALALVLDPYPREADAVFDRVDTDPDPDARPHSAFEALVSLVPRDDEDKN